MEKVKQMETTDKKSNLVSSSLKNSEPKNMSKIRINQRKKGKIKRMKKMKKQTL